VYQCIGMAKHGNRKRQQSLHDRATQDQSIVTQWEPDPGPEPPQNGACMYVYPGGCSIPYLRARSTESSIGPLEPWRAHRGIQGHTGVERV